MNDLLFALYGFALERESLFAAGLSIGLALSRLG